MMITKKGEKYINLDHDKRPVTIEYGAECPIVIQKMFGTLVARDIRVDADLERAEWIVAATYPSPNDPSLCEWKEVIRIPMQDADGADDSASET